MTSNLAASEIAEHGLQLRREAEEIAKERAKGTLEETKMEERITISRHFKDKGTGGGGLQVRPDTKNFFINYFTMSMPHAAFAVAIFKIGRALFQR